MPKLPSVSGKQLVKALERAGFEVLRQRGSHVTLVRRATRSVVVVPVHVGRDLPPGTLTALLKAAGIGTDDMRRLLR